MIWAGAKGKGMTMKVTTEKEAWELLTKLLQGHEQNDIEFENWPVLNIKIRGDEYSSSLNSRQMAALVGLEHVFGRAYSVVAHGAYDMRRLKADEEEDLQFTTSVKEGSSILETDLTPLVKAFSTAVAAHPQLALVSALVLGLAMVSRPIILKYYETRAKQLDFEDKKLLITATKQGNRDDSEKIKLLDKAIDAVTGAYPQFAQVVPDAREAFWRLASASVDAETLTIEGIDFSQSELELLSNRRARRPGNTKEVREVCKINYVRTSGAGFIVGVEGKNIALGAKFKKPHLTETKIKKLMNLMAAGTKIDAVLEIRVVDKANLSGRLISFKPVIE